MPAAVRKTIITCAVTGAVHSPTMSEHLPITPQEIADFTTWLISLIVASSKLRFSSRQSTEFLEV
jgi:hypothetical protein